MWRTESHSGARDLGPENQPGVDCVARFGGRVIPALRRLNEPASDSQLGMALVVAAVTMGLMLWAIIWQGNIIAYQRDLIRVMQAAQFGGMG